MLFFLSNYFYFVLFSRRLCYFLPLFTFFVMSVHAKIVVDSSLLFVQIITLFPLRHLIILSAYLQACSGGEMGGVGRSGKPKTLRRKSSARNENNDKYT